MVRPMGLAALSYMNSIYWTSVQMESTRHQDQIANHTREHYDHDTGRQVHLSEATRVMN